LKWFEKAHADIIHQARIKISKTSKTPATIPNGINLSKRKTILMALHPTLAEILSGEEIKASREAFKKLGMSEQRQFVDTLSKKWDSSNNPLEEILDITLEGPYGEIPIRTYRATQSKSDLPCYIHFHGGAWWLGSLESVDGICRHIAENTKCLVVSVGYHLAPEFKFPVQIEECYFVVKWCAEHAQKLGIDAGRIAIGGRSAGGNLAAATCLLARDRGGPSILFQTLEVPATDLRMNSESQREYGEGYLLNRADQMQALGYYLNSEEEKSNPLASPLLAEDLANLPPAYITTMECDPLRDEGEEYGKRLMEANVPCVIKRYDGLIHEYVSYEKEIPEISKIRLSLIEFINKSFSTDLRRGRS